MPYLSMRDYVEKGINFGVLKCMIPGQPFYNYMLGGVSVILRCYLCFHCQVDRVVETKTVKLLTINRFGFCHLGILVA